MSSGLIRSDGIKRQKFWQHPLHRKIRVPHKAAAAIAIMEMGVSDLAQIANAVGLSLDEVVRIDQVEDPLVRKLCGARIPYGVYFRLQDKIRCPKCDAWITIAPCVSCDRRPKPEGSRSF